MGLRTKTRRCISRLKYPMEIYKPMTMKMPENIVDVDSSWKGLEVIIEDVLNRFGIERNKCIEFGTEYGYSSVVFSNFFKQVKGVDIFVGDIHSGLKEDHYLETSEVLAPFENIQLIQSDYKDYIKKDDQQYDFAHVDIIHTYKETYECGLWAVEHSKCCLFHDTESYPEVRKAVYDIAKQTGKKVYNYPYNHGLGIIV